MSEGISYNSKSLSKRLSLYPNDRLTLDEKNNNDESNLTTTDTINTKKLPLPPNRPSNNQSTSSSSARPRRRRKEMQAITMIIETRDFPYNDEYVWKNNGNTIHKNSGQKSIYYKCSNSNAVRIFKSKTCIL